MEINQISGQRQYEFMKKFTYIREAGTPGEETASQMIAEELQKLNVPYQIETFSFDTYEIKQATFRITEPYEKEYKVSGYIGCGSTEDSGVEAPFLYIENGDDISLSFAQGKIVMINGPVRKDTYQKLINAGAVGFLSIYGSPVDEGEDLIPYMYSIKPSSPTLQGASIHHKDAIEIVEQGACRAQLIVKQEKVTKTSRNIVATIAGTDKADEILTVTAHYDSVPAGPGAYDNMAGSAIIMELCHYFSSYRPRRTLTFIWFGAEEKGLLGSQNYVTVHENELNHHCFNMNVDLAGQLVGGTVIGVTGDNSICHMLSYMAHEVGIGTSFKNSIWGSDSNTFAWKGIPAMTLNRDGYGMHTCHDTIDLISPWSLERSASLLGYIADSLANIEIMPIPRTIPEEFMKQLNQYFDR